jgi:hypothetical protein
MVDLPGGTFYAFDECVGLRNAGTGKYLGYHGQAENAQGQRARATDDKACLLQMLQVVDRRFDDDRLELACAACPARSSNAS